MSQPAKKEYQQLIDQIAQVYQAGRKKIGVAVNANLVETYWEIGQYIIEYEQSGQLKANYGEGLLKRLSRDLTKALGKGFSRSNLQRMRQFYHTYPKRAEVPHKLSWTHFVELLKIEDPLERRF